jgi:hypothetical protein
VSNNAAIGEQKMTDWSKIRSNPWSSDYPEDWPRGVKSISLEGLSLFGIHEKSKRLHWDGDEVVTKNVVRLGAVERSLAAAAAIGTFGVFALEVGRSLGLWH